MPLTYDIELPLNEELTVPEVTLTTGALRAGSVYFGKFCETESKEFMLCKDDFDDPRKCINEGKDVTACALNFFRKMKETCYEEFQAYATCLETKSVDYQVSKCRKPQAVYDKCVLENFNIQRPSVGYYGIPKIHETKYPKPEPKQRPTFEKPPKLPADEYNNPVDSIYDYRRMG